MIESHDEGVPLADTSPARHELAQRIKSTQFPVGKPISGYEIEGVDGFLDQLAADVGEGVDAVELITRILAVRFPPRRWRQAYQASAVDDFFETVAFSLRDLGRSETAR